MPAFRLGISLSAAISGIALAILIQPGAGFAYTPEQQQACSPDAMRLCGEFVPNVDAITACMIQKKAQLSPQCRVFFRDGPEGQPVSLKPASKKRTMSKPAAAKSTTASKKKKPKSDEG